jgi:RNA polymerase sigma-70 factor (ECF subfamily)
LTVSELTAARYAQLDPDVRLMLAVRDGDAEAFERIVTRYEPRLLTILHHLVGSRDQAEDLAQEVFLRVFRARKSYQPGARFATWLFTIAHHVASNARRTKARRREITLRPRQDDSQSMPALEQLAKAGSGTMPAKQMDRAETAEIVRLAIQSLSARQRMAVLLCKFEDMSYADIGEVMKLSPKAIKSLLSRARVNLRDILEPYLADGQRPPEQGSSS